MNDPKLSISANYVYERAARDLGWQSAVEVGFYKGHGVVHSEGLWAKTWKEAFQRFHIDELGGKLVSNDYE